MDQSAACPSVSPCPQPRRCRASSLWESPSCERTQYGPARRTDLVGTGRSAAEKGVQTRESSRAWQQGRGPVRQRRSGRSGPIKGAAGRAWKGKRRRSMVRTKKKLLSPRLSLCSVQIIYRRPDTLLFIWMGTTPFAARACLLAGRVGIIPPSLEAQAAVTCRKFLPVVHV